MTMKDKPPYGAACNNCGRCCERGRCPVSTEVFGEGQGGCPALAFGASGSRCELITDPQKHVPKLCETHGVDAVSKAAAALTVAGIGCDMRSTFERDNPFARHRMMARINWEEVEKARQIFLI